jgi:hypothetical protein
MTAVPSGSLHSEERSSVTDAGRSFVQDFGRCVLRVRPSAVWLVTQRLLHLNESSHLALRRNQGLVTRY